VSRWAGSFTPVDARSARHDGDVRLGAGGDEDGLRFPVDLRVGGADVRAGPLDTGRT
jgi:hypothetical protein